MSTLSHKTSCEALLKGQALDALLSDVKNVRIGVIGDFCLDVYWQVDQDISELSVETNVRTTPVTEQRFSLGGAGNVAANIMALGANVSVFSVRGNDPFGEKMHAVIDQCGINGEGLLVQDVNWATHAYVKPMIDGVEASRIDFGRTNELQVEIADQLIAVIEAALPNLDAIAINQQIPNILHNTYFCDKLHALIQRHPEKLAVLDGRDVAEVYTACWHKMNDFEACRLVGMEYQPLDEITAADAQKATKQLFQKWQQPLIVSRGEHGVFVCDANGIQEVQGLALSGPIDSVGAGDSLLAGVVVSMACG
ncbi:MAG: hypothetical protein HRU15_08405, partial [Planctomycetes bacterium]|nr:hypothetical protein [Planctomycetota bacterium]